MFPSKVTGVSFGFDEALVALQPASPSGNRWLLALLGDSFSAALLGCSVAQGHVGLQGAGQG